MNIFADYHTHTIYSHGKGTIEDNVKAAVNIGLEEIAITDHGPANIGVGIKVYDLKKIKEDIRQCRKNYPGIKILLGIEANVTGLDGTLDIPKSLYKDLDILLVGLHPFVKPASLKDGYNLFIKNQIGKIYSPWSRKARETNTKALVEAIYKNKIDIITHPGLKVSIDTRELARAAVKRGTALEINSSHGYLSEEYIKIARKEGVKFVINSDAHTPWDVGNVARGIALAEKTGLTHTDIINAKKD